MKLEQLERKSCAVEWDGGWFCDKCDKLMSWKQKAYMLNNKKLCKECAEKAVK